MHHLTPTQALAVSSGNKVRLAILWFVVLAWSGPPGPLFLTGTELPSSPPGTELWSLATLLILPGI